MKKGYVLTGYDVSKTQLTTNRIDDIETVYDIIKYYSKDTLTKKYPNSHDLNFDVEARRSHSNGVIISDTNFKWSIYKI